MLGYTVEFQPLGQRVHVPVGTSLLDAGRQIGLELNAICGGRGSCGACRVTVFGTVASAPDVSERALLSMKELDGGVRLACRVRVGADLKVHVSPEHVSATQRLQLEGNQPGIAVHAAVRCMPVEVLEPSLVDARSDLERVCSALGPARGRWSTEISVVAQLSGLARACEWRLQAYLRGDEIVGFARPGQAPLGLAFDLGCTKIAGYLLDLESGTELCAAGISNPQLGYGEDLVSRLVFARAATANARVLADAARDALNALGKQLLEEAGAQPEQVAEMCLVGNPAMTHIMLGLPVDQLVKAPYVSAISASLEVPAHELSLSAAPGARVYVLPAIGGWVGADHVAVLLAARADRARRTVLSIDVGTNTEISICVPTRRLLLAASCPSGPALEGGHVRDGMRAAQGAIERVRVQRGSMVVDTIGGAPALGLCGSGIIDAVAALRRQCLMDARGHLRRDGLGVRAGRNGLEYVLVPAAGSGHGRSIGLTQADLGEVQLAKAAIRAGIETVLAAAGLLPEEVGVVVMAGAFGAHLDLNNAVAIGMLPDFVGARYVQAGNAAGTGAKMALISTRARSRAERLAKWARRIDLKSDPQFNGRLARATRFPESPVGRRTRAKEDGNYR